MIGKADLTDDIIVERVLSGERDLYGVLVERYRLEFARYAGALCNDSDTAADAMQNAFIKAFDSLATCREPAKFKSWFFTILRNMCHNARSRTRSHLSLDEVDLPAREKADDRLGRSELGDLLADAMDALTYEQREAFTMKHVEERSYKEMAELLDADEDALKMRVYRARDAVRKHIEAHA